MRGEAVSLDPFHNPIFEMKLTLGTVILGVMGVIAIASITYEGTQWVDSVTSHLSRLDGEIANLSGAVSDLNRKLDACHFTNPEKRTDAAPPAVTGVP